MRKNEVLFRFLSFSFHLLKRGVFVQLVQYVDGRCFVDEFRFDDLRKFYSCVVDAVDCCDRLLVSYSLDDVHYNKVVDLINTKNYSNVSFWCSIVKPLIFD